VAGGRELVVCEEMTPIVEPSVDEQLAKELVERARSEGAQFRRSPGERGPALECSSVVDESCARLAGQIAHSSGVWLCGEPVG
jgi:hypothetical protein